MAEDVRKRASVMRVEAALREAGLGSEIVELRDTARSAKEAADALGCEVGQIVKSLVFCGTESSAPFLVVASGSNRVDESKLAELAGEPLERPDAKFVKKRTGYSIGGVPPTGHPEEIPTFMDEDLCEYDEVWAAAGHPHAVFMLSPDELASLTGAKLMSVKPD